MEMQPAGTLSGAALYSVEISGTGRALTTAFLYFDTDDIFSGCKTGWAPGL